MVGQIFFSACRFQTVLIVLMVSMLFIMPARTLRSQEVTGGITGLVTDPSGAAVPGATVTAKDMERGTVWPTTTNAAGVYNLPRLVPSRYLVTASGNGFQTSVYPAFQLQMNQIARIDFNLHLGSVTQTVSVTSTAPLLQTGTMQVGLVTSSNFNVNLPLATRNFVQLTLLAPGVTTVDPNSFTNGQRTQPTVGGGRPYVNGNREEGNNFLLDGIDNNQISANQTSYQPSPDAIQEFDLITNNAPAQYGQFQGGIVSVTLKSGTDQFHGDAFEFLRNSGLDANSWSNNWKGIPKPGLRWNTFGGTFGGPIKKDKLFLFADYDGERLDSPPAIGAYSVMMPAERSGDFSALLPGRQLYNPCASMSGPCTERANPLAVRQPFVNNQIPASMIDPVASKLFSSGEYPLPVKSGLLNNALNTSASETINNQGDLKVNYAVNSKNYVWGSYSEGFQQIPATNSVLLLGQSFNNSPFHAGVIDWTRIFSPTFVMDAKIGVSRVYFSRGSAVTGLGNFAETIGVADGNIHGPGMPGIRFTNGFASTVGASDSQTNNASTTLEPAIDILWTRGRHSFDIGFEALRHDINAYYAGNNGKYGQFLYSGQYTDGPNPASPVSHGISEADFLLGLPNTVELGIQGATWGQRSWVYAPYIQDDWRLTDRLTLNMGLRWEYNQPWYEAYNRQANFGLFSGTEYLAGQSNCPYSDCRALYNSDYRDWEPRFGFAYALGKNNVIRGAYTVSSFLEGTGTNLRLPLNPPFQEELTAIYSSTTAPYTQYFPGSTTDQGFSKLTSSTNPIAGATIRLWDPSVEPNTVQQWNFSIEHQFASQMLLSIGYIGQHGTNLMTAMPYLQKRLPGEAGCPSTATAPCGSPYMAGNPAVYNVISQISGTASNSDQAYDALQVSLTKHLTRGLEFQLSYTYSKGMTNSVGYYGEGGQAYANSGYWQNLYDETAEWGPTYFNETHNLTSAYTYMLPFGTGKRFSIGNRAANYIIGNWRFTGIFTYHTGFPLSTTANDASGTQSRGARANCIGPTTYTGAVGPGTSWFSTAVFSQPVSGTFGSCANGTVIGPGLTDWDAGFQKDFPITESKRLQFRAEFINFANTPIFGAPSTMSVDSTQFGDILSSEYSRTIQFALKFYY